MDSLIKIPEKLPEPINQFLKALLGPSFTELGLLLGDQIKLVRFSRGIKILKKAQKKLVSANINPRNIDLKFLVPFLEKSTLEQDEYLVDKWAGLLASAASNKKLSYNYINILSELNPVEVKLLENMYKANKRNGSTYIDWKVQGFNKEKICTSLIIPDDDYELIVNNLSRLYLCQSIGLRQLTPDQIPLAIKSSRIINLTQLGYDFVKTCHGPMKRKSHKTRTKSKKEKISKKTPH
jgi:hypothetical protein